MPKNENGRKGEDYAAKLLEEKGYTVIERNFHSRYGEVDIIAEKENVLAFVEVKTRSSNSWGSAAGAVTASKQHKLIKAAQYFLMTHNTEHILRFDVVALTTAPGSGFRVIKCEHFEGAFDLNVQNGFC